VHGPIPVNLALSHRDC